MVIRIGLESLPPFLAAALRFTLAFFCLFCYSLIKRKPILHDIKKHLFFIRFAFLNFTAGYACVYWAEQYIGSGLASVLFSVMPFYVLFLSIRLLPEEQITRTKTLGILLGFIGVALVFRDQLRFSQGDFFFMLGMILVLIGPLFSALGTISAKHAMKHIDILTLNTIPLFYTACSFYLLYFLFETNQTVTCDTKALFSIIYLGLVGTALAFILYFWLLRTRSAVIMSMITFITPPVALFWGWFILGEPITISLMFGLTVIFIGILLVRKR
jgi:drug/metabolite transporter (DMT)-like permease